MTFIQIAGVSGTGTPYYGAASDCTTGFGGGDGFWAGPITMNGQSQQGFTFFSSANTITAPVTGTYVVGYRASFNDQQGHKGGIRMVRNGSTTIGQMLGTTTAEGRCGASSQTELGFSCVVTLNAGDTIQLQGYQSWGVAGASMYIAFIPTPLYKR